MTKSPQAIIASYLFISGAALAETVTVTFNGATYSTALTVYRPSGSATPYDAGLLSVTIGGEDFDAYCVDLDHTIDAGITYTAELVAMEAEDPWCAIAWILAYSDASDATSSAAVQVALWKLIEPGLTVSDATIDADADALIDEASGTCPLTCDESADFDVTTTEYADGTIEVEIHLSQGGVDVVGQAVTLAIGGGTLVSPADGVGMTDEDGIVVATVDPGTEGAFSMDVTVDGRTLYRIDPTSSYQQLLAFAYETCSTSDTVDWYAAALGNPRTIGFWKQQTAMAVGASRAKPKVTEATLESWLPLDIFGTKFSTVDEMYTALWLSRASTQKRAIQQCLAMRLNLEWGEVGWYSDIDLDLDGTSDGLFWELWQEAETAYAAGDYLTAKDICDDFNNL